MGKTEAQADWLEHHNSEGEGGRRKEEAGKEERSETRDVKLPQTGPPLRKGEGGVLS